MNIKEEPVLVGGVIASIMSFLAMAVALGWLTIGGDQMEAIKAFMVAFLPMLVVVITLIGSWWGRRNAVSVEKLIRNGISPDLLL
jgi:hypothetical protein